MEVKIIIKYLGVCSLLPPQFPQEKPVISVFPPIRHHIMDKQGAYVTSPLINSVRIKESFSEIINGKMYVSFKMCNWQQLYFIVELLMFLSADLLVLVDSFPMDVLEQNPTFLE